MTKLLRLSAAATVVAPLVLMLGPFQGAEEAFGLSDGVAHVAAFAWITMAMMWNIPAASRVHIGMAVLFVGLAVEVIQGALGRDADLADVLADTIGITVALCLFPRRRLV